MATRYFSYRVNATAPNKRAGQVLIVRAPNKDDALRAFHDATEGKMVDWDIEVERLNAS